VDALIKAAMLESPAPVAVCAANDTSSMSTAPLTLLTERAGPPVADVDVTSAVVPAEYAQVPEVHVSAP
jgi:hypothetical protein